MTEKAKKKTTPAQMVFLIGCVVLGLIIGLFLSRDMFKPQWQRQEDEEIELHRKEGNLDFYILNRFTDTLRPDGQARYEYSSAQGERFSYQDLYDYASEKLGYKCEQLAPYDDHTPHNEMAKCAKQ